MKNKPYFPILTKDLTFGFIILLLIGLSCFHRFSGISSLLFLLKLFFRISIFPIQICWKIYENFPFNYNSIKNSSIFSIYCKILMFYKNCQNFVFNHHFNILQISKNGNNSSNSLILIFIVFIYFFVSVFIFSFVSWESTFLGTSNKLKCSNSRASVFQFIKRMMILVLRPVIILIILIKFVLLLFVTVSINLISSCTPQMIRNVTHRLMNSSVNLFLLLFKRISSFSVILYVICIIFGFLLNKVTNFGEFNVYLESLSKFLKFYNFDSSMETKSQNIPDSYIQQLLKTSNILYFLNMIIENVIQLPKMIFHTFEIT